MSSVTFPPSDFQHTSIAPLFIRALVRVLVVMLRVQLLHAYYNTDDT